MIGCRFLHRSRSRSAGSPSVASTAALPDVRSHTAYRLPCRCQVPSWAPPAVVGGRDGLADGY